MGFPVYPNYDEVKDFSPIPAGEYSVKAVDVKGDRSQKSGAAMLKWELQITEGPQFGKALKFTTMTEGPGAGILRQFLEMLNPTYNGGEFDAEKYLNRDFVVETALVAGTKEGSFFANVKNFKPATSSFTGDVT